MIVMSLLMTTLVPSSSRVVRAAVPLLRMETGPLPRAWLLLAMTTAPLTVVPALKELLPATVSVLSVAVL